MIIKCSGFSQTLKHFEKVVKFCSYHFWLIKFRIFRYCTGPKLSNLLFENHFRQDIIYKIASLAYSLSVTRTECEGRISLSMKRVQNLKSVPFDQLSAIKPMEFANVILLCTN